MLQLFFQTSKITAKQWAKAYQRIESIVDHFPLKLLRVEAYNGYQATLDKDHFDLREHVGTPDECLSFYGDWVSYTTRGTMRFYKNWDKYVKNELEGEESDANKPITWFPHYPFKNDGTMPQANGATLNYGYMNPEGAAYEYAILAIAIMLENELPNRVFLTAMEQDIKNIEEVVAWLEVHFNERFELPIHFDKKRLLASFVNEYVDKSQVVCRMEHLFRKQYKRNMIFALENIGYAPTFDFYAEVLSDNTFGTFGFSDVLDPWIAATQDIESTLALIAAAQKLTLEKGEKKEAKEYDFAYILKDLLGDFILWTPQQREELDHFYTNKEALETGDESLWGMLYRMTGNRVNICPVYATQQELFEAFMYHEPKKGGVFKKIIDEWVEKNADAFQHLKEKLAANQAQDDESLEENADENRRNDAEQSVFLLNYPKHEQPFIELALSMNAAYPMIEKHIKELKVNLQGLAEADENKTFVNNIKSDPKEYNIKFIRRRIKDIKLCVHPHFEQWLDKENDKNVLLYLTVLMSLKMYERSRHYARYRLLWDNTLWDSWRQPTKI